MAEDFRTNELHRALPNDTSTVLKARLAGTGAMALSDEETSEAYLAIKPLAKLGAGVLSKSSAPPNPPTDHAHKQKWNEYAARQIEPLVNVQVQMFKWRFALEL